MDLNVGLPAPILWISGFAKQVQDLFVVQLQETHNVYVSNAEEN